MSKNPRITKKERGLIKGALRRVFSRSELRREVVAASIIDYRDPNRPRVKKWSQCKLCATKTPTYLIVIDHIDPVVPIEMAFEDMSVDVVIDRIWCEKNNLQFLCETCHNAKSKLENKARREFKKGKKKHEQ
jgi:5-methylcytosine-specific restriction endonuclease McrA